MGVRPAVALLLAGLIVVPAAGGWGAPERRVRDGVTASYWRLRPGTLVTPERRVFRILVTETACASGQPATGRIEEPLVIRERARVQVAMFVRPLDGPAACPSNPPTPYTLRLDGPLGDRALADGGTMQPRPVRGRLTRRGFQRAILRLVSDTADAAWSSWRRLEKIGDEVATARVRCGHDLNDRIYGMPSTERAECAIARLQRRGYRVFGE